MEATVLYLLMPQKYTNQSKRIWNKVIFIVLRNSTGFTANNMKKIGLNRYVYDFSINYSVIDTSNIVDIPKYLMKNEDIK